MFKILSACCAAGFSLGLAGLAHAADLAYAPDQNSNPVRPSCGNWSGIYVGGHAGYIRGTGTGKAPALDLDATVNMDGFLGGPLLGANYQIGCTVLGIEGDVGLGNVGGFNANINLPGTRDGGGSRGNINGHIRGRLGYSFGKFMPFMAGGLALANTKMYSAHGSDKNTHTGVTLGGGVDWAATDNIILRGEYLYDSYASKTYKIYRIDAIGKLNTHTLRAAVMFKF